ncbi:MAG: polysaccharide export protein EpsE [Betaproteobacteria bacterium]|nr:polysaccharide export protein EpsE [Betaproteobacteria bacterium]
MPVNFAKTIAAASLMLAATCCLAQSAPRQTPARAPTQPGPWEQAPMRAAPMQQAPAQASVPQAPAQAAARDEYRLGVGDVIRITVYDQPDLLTEVEISEGGSVSMPLVGEVKVGGMTRVGAARSLEASLKSGGFLKEPNVIVRVLEYRSQNVSVLGEVGKPGKYPVTRPTSLTEVIAVAGGITAKGSETVTVVQTASDGTVERHEVYVGNQMNSGSAARNLLIRAGDTVFVPVLPVFYVYGEVRQPGSYPLAAGMTVMQALSVGGGLTPRGSERGIRIERRDAGKVVSRAVRGTDKLRPNDVLRVPESWF